MSHHGKSTVSIIGIRVEIQNIPKIKQIPDAKIKMDDNLEPSDRTLEKKDKPTAGAIDIKIT